MNAQLSAITIIDLKIMGLIRKAGQVLESLIGCSQYFHGLLLYLVYIETGSSVPNLSPHDPVLKNEPDPFQISRNSIGTEIPVLSAVVQNDFSEYRITSAFTAAMAERVVSMSCTPQHRW